MTRIVLLLTALLLVSGCGYRLPAAQRQYDGVTSYSVGIFRNASYRVGLDTVMRRMLDEELSTHQGLAVRPAGEGDAEFTGTVLSYKASAASYTKDDKVREYRAAMTVEAELRQLSSNRPLWKGTIAVTKDFPANTNLPLQQSSEEAALQELARKAARQIYLRQQDDF